MIWQEIPRNGLLRLALTPPAVLALLVEATATAPTTTRAIVTAPLRPAAATTFLSGPLYTCNAEGLSAMHQNNIELGACQDNCVISYKYF